MNKEFYYRERKRLTKLYNTGFFGEAKNGGRWTIIDKKGNKTGVAENLDFILRPEDSKANLFASLRQKAMDYFEKYHISWWRQEEDGYFPTGHLVSSQIHCLNHLFAFRNKPKALKLILCEATQLPIAKVLKSPIDEDGYIAFEFVYNNMSLMCDNSGKYHENYETRGTKCTSIDALVYAQLEDKRKILIPIEWKYTETYNGKKAHASSWKRYPDLIRLEDCNLKEVYDIYRADPFYELMRQTLLVEQIIRHKDCGIKADDYFHIMVIPNEHTELKSAIEGNYIPTLKDQSKFRIIAPQELLSPIAGNKNFEDLISYLQIRYWKK